MKNRIRFRVQSLGQFLLGITVSQSASAAIPMSGLRIQVEPFVELPSTIGSLGNKKGEKIYESAPAMVDFMRVSEDGRFFINDKRGQIYIYDQTNQTITTLVDIDKDNGGSESIFPAVEFSSSNTSGLRGFAFHPEFTDNGIFYTIHSEKASQTNQTVDFAPDYSNIVSHIVINEWQLADPYQTYWDETTDKRRELLRVGSLHSGHSFVDLQFNPAANLGDSDYGKLYISGGDWGYYGDDAQILNSLAGKVLRIDPRSPQQTGGMAGVGNYTVPADNPFVNHSNGTLGEIYALGFRSGHRMSWSQDGQLFVTEIGADHAEEVNRVIAGGNYGWPKREGIFINGLDTENGGNGEFSDVFVNTLTPEQDVDARNQSYLYPVVQYTHSDCTTRKGCAISNGFHYTGELLPHLKGKFIFGDIPSGRVFIADSAAMFSKKMTIPAATIPIEEVTFFETGALGEEMNFVLEDIFQNRVDLRFARDLDGEIYLLTKLDGMVRKLVASTNSSSPVTSSTQTASSSIALPVATSVSSSQPSAIPSLPFSVAVAPVSVDVTPTSAADTPVSSSAPSSTSQGASSASQVQSPSTSPVRSGGSSMYSTQSVVPVLVASALLFIASKMVAGL